MNPSVLFCNLGTRRLISVLGIACAGVLVFQYFEVPYGTVLSSLFPAANFSLARNGSSRSQHHTDVLQDDESGSSKSAAPSASLQVQPQINSSPVQDKAHPASFDTSTSSKDVLVDNSSGSLSSATPSASLQPRIDSSLVHDNAHPPSFNTSTAAAPVTVNKTTIQNNALPPSLNTSTAAAPATVNKTTIRNETVVTFTQNTTIRGENYSSLPAEKKKSRRRIPILSISEMNSLLLHNLASPVSTTPKWSSTVDQELIFAKSHIQNASELNSTQLYSPLYRDVSMFTRSYELMESILKIYIYEEGERPIFHHPILDGIYASEGWFMKLLEENKKFVTKDPREAHLFYIPFSSRMLELTLYKRNSHKRKNLVEYMKNYTDMIAAKYDFWNRSDGADHFLAACHDWAATETRGRMLNCIRALCNADIKAGFVIGKDVSLPETYVRSAKDPLKDLGGNLPSQRSVLAFFAGNMHGSVRPILSNYWQDKDPDMKIFVPLPHVKGDKNYIEYMKNSKYCICAKGFEVNSPRIVEAIFFECVPVIISDNFVPPFFEVFNWESFAIFVAEKDIPNLKTILSSVSEERYMEMHKRVQQIQQHFLWHDNPVKYDLFHMILHSVWYNRIFQFRPA